MVVIYENDFNFFCIFINILPAKIAAGIILNCPHQKGSNFSDGIIV